jgi:hypothetical protein
MANASEWSKRVASWRASGLSAEQFCVDKEYTAKSMWHWSSRLGRMGRMDKVERRGGSAGVVSQPAVAVARVVRAGEISPSGSSGSLTVELNGARIEVQGAVPAATLRAVFAVLREASDEVAR